MISLSTSSVTTVTLLPNLSSKITLLTEIKYCGLPVIDFFKKYNLKSNCKLSFADFF